MPSAAPQLSELFHSPDFEAHLGGWEAAAGTHSDRESDLEEGLYAWYGWDDQDELGQQVEMLTGSTADEFKARYGCTFGEDIPQAFVDRDNAQDAVNSTSDALFDWAHAQGMTEFEAYSLGEQLRRRNTADREELRAAIAGTVGNLTALNQFTVDHVGEMFVHINLADAVGRFDAGGISIKKNVVVIPVVPNVGKIALDHGRGVKLYPLEPFTIGTYDAEKPLKTGTSAELLSLPKLDIATRRDQVPLWLLGDVVEGPVEAVPRSDEDTAYYHRRIDAIRSIALEVMGVRAP